MFTHRIDQDLELRLPDEKDAEPWFQLIDQNRDYLRAWFRFIDDIQNLGEAEIVFREILNGIALGSTVYTFIYARDKFVGCVWAKVNSKDQSADLGYWLSQEHIGHGYATRACSLLIRHLFDDLSLNRAVIQCTTENAPSKSIAERLGFSHEGVSRKALRFQDQFKDLENYSLLASEWREMQAV